MLVDPHTARLRAALHMKAVSGGTGGVETRTLAAGAGWRVLDIVCTAGPRDRAFEERHSEMTISFVLAGSFTYRGTYGRALLTPGALLLGEADRCFECGHEHGEGDRCLSFHYLPELFEGIAADAGARRPDFGRSALGPLPSFSPLASRAFMAMMSEGDLEEIALDLAVQTLRACSDVGQPARNSAKDERRTAEAMKLIEARLDEPLALATLAEAVGISPFRFMHVFRNVTGTSPHQYRMRLRLREAALRLLTTGERIVDISLASGFDDLSNFTRSFRREFGMSPSQYRMAGNGRKGARPS